MRTLQDRVEYEWTGYTTDVDRTKGTACFEEVFAMWSGACRSLRKATFRWFNIMLNNGGPVGRHCVFERDDSEAEWILTSKV